MLARRYTVNLSDGLGLDARIKRLQLCLLRRQRIIINLHVWCQCRIQFLFSFDRCNLAQLSFTAQASQLPTLAKAISLSHLRARWLIIIILVTTHMHVLAFGDAHHYVMTRLAIINTHT